MADDPVFRALADPTRREILDALFEREGQSLGELEQLFDMTRFGVMKHVKVLEQRISSSPARSGGHGCIT